MREIGVTTSLRTQWVDITEQVQDQIARLHRGDSRSAAVLVYCPHTTAAVTINEGWDPAVAEDVDRALARLVPDISYRHSEGNSPAHLMASLVGPSVVVPVRDGALLLGRWQRIFFCEFDGPRRRSVWVRLLA